MTGGAGIVSLAIALSATSPDDVPCWRARVALAADRAISARDVEPMACAAGPATPTRYDRGAQTVRTVEAVAAGAPLGLLPPLPDAVVQDGAELFLRVSSGAVTIERRVTAAQSGRAGRRLFVRDDTGAIFAAPLALGRDE